MTEIEDRYREVASQSALRLHTILARIIPVLESSNEFPRDFYLFEGELKDFLGAMIVLGSEQQVELPPEEMVVVERPFKLLQFPHNNLKGDV